MTDPPSASEEETRLAAAATAPPRAASASQSTMQHRNDDESRNESRSERALRVSQLDADEMDSGLIHMLNAKISRALGVFGVSALYRCCISPFSLTIKEIAQLRIEICTRGSPCFEVTAVPTWSLECPG